MGLVSKISSFKKRKSECKRAKELEELNIAYENEKQKSRFKSLISNLKFETYTKRLVGIIVIVGLIDLQLSYVLAFLDKVQIAESLSNQICVTLLGTILVYVIRAYFDTKAEKHDEMVKSGLIVDKNSTIIPNEVIENKVREIIANSGISEHVNIEDLIPPSRTDESQDPNNYNL